MAEMVETLVEVVDEQMIAVLVFDETDESEYVESYGLQDLVPFLVLVLDRRYCAKIIFLQHPNCINPDNID